MSERWCSACLEDAEIDNTFGGWCGDASCCPPDYCLPCGCAGAFIEYGDKNPMSDFELTNKVFARVVAELAVSQAFDMSKFDGEVMNRLRQGIAEELGELPAAPHKRSDQKENE